MLYKKGILEHFVKSTGKQLFCKISFNTVQFYVKKHLKTVACDVLLVFMVKTLQNLLMSKHL